MIDLDVLNKEIDACTADLNAALGHVGGRHRPYILSAALASHLGWSLATFIQSGLITDEDAKRVIERIRQIGLGEQA